MNLIGQSKEEKEIAQLKAQIAALRIELGFAMTMTAVVIKKLATQSGQTIDMSNFAKPERDSAAAKLLGALRENDGD